MRAKSYGDIGSSEVGVSCSNGFLGAAGLVVLIGDNAVLGPLATVGADAADLPPRRERRMWLMLPLEADVDGEATDGARDLLGSMIERKSLVVTPLFLDSAPVHLPMWTLPAPMVIGLCRTNQGADYKLEMIGCEFKPGAVRFEHHRTDFFSDHQTQRPHCTHVVGNRHNACRIQQRRLVRLCVGLVVCLVLLPGRARRRGM